MSEQAGEKTEQPTEKRKRDARKKGTVARSTELNGALVLMAAALTLPGAVSKLGPELVETFRQFAWRGPTDLSPTTVARVASVFIGPFAAAFAPVLGAILATSLASNFAQVGFSASGQPMVPDFKRIDPFQGFKRLLSRRSFFDGFKALAKLALFVMIAWGAVAADWHRVLSIGGLSGGQAATVVAELAHTIVVRVAGAWLAIAALDYAFQRHQTNKQLMMTKDEVRREMKEQEGSPEVKMVQSQRRRRLAKGALASNLKKADVVVTNPTHYAVAVAYERDKHHAPIVVAKGADFLALRIRELAKDLAVPVVENRRLARSLYNKCEVGDFVPRELFGPVAEILAYVYKTLKKVRK
ncbi:MAG: EscU/YscU/HrcU family type III secretion system export apparatus switch protein [Fimbriimonadaceae bacterium]|nr:EscU/YscU/HrcU family type III secretion system export apparatus switch protein [Fimbriimonadaceae bacterium]QYK58972.1 MAG: EscU/YscU/HrcU family type III secretion system export apparatus switch protein [Fimbriimonadaceae bacterium]